MKKITALVLSLITVFTLVACGNSGSGSSGKTLDLKKVQENLGTLEYFPSSMELDDATLKSAYGLDASLLKEKLIGVPMMNVHASMYWVLLPQDGKTDDVKTAMSKYFESYQASWDTYLPDQAELVRNRMETEIETKDGTWLVYIISEDNNKTLEQIQGGLS
ncbi:MAG: DUF4358 domain-containing protein [Oscillospiraceae bacterium]